MEELQARKTKVESDYRKIIGKLWKVEKQMAEFARNNYPQCLCCGMHRNPKTMWLATQEEVDNYTGHVYDGPSEGEWYCGC